jgi:hypothetical protein
MRAIKLSSSELQEYNDNLIAQAENLRRMLVEISVYSNGSINLQDLYNMPMIQIKQIEEIITKKIKSENNVTGKEYL